MSEQPDGLRHTLSPGLVGLIAVGGVIGAGLFVGSAASIQSAGALVLPLYAVAGLLTMLQMWILAEMAFATPEAGSFIGQIRHRLGARAGFIAGWAYVLFWGATAGSEVIAAGPLLRSMTGWPVLVGSGLALGVTLVANLVSAKAYARTEGALSLTKLVAIVSFILFGLASALTHPLHGFSLSRVVEGGWAPHGFVTAIATLPILVQTLTGFEIATIAALESSDPLRSVRYAARSLVMRVGGFYVVSLLVILGIAPHGAITVGHSPFATALACLNVPGVSTLMTLVVLVAVVSCLNSALFATSRAVRELAAVGDAPAVFLRVNAKGVPVATVALAAVIEIMVAGMGVLSPRQGYVVALSLAAALILVDYVLAGLAQIRGRRMMIVPEALRMWGFPVLSWLAVAAFTAVFFSMALDPGARVDFALGLVSVVVLAMAAWVRYRRA